MKKCRNCSEKIPASARVCPYCGAKIKRPIYKAWWFWLLLILVAVILVVAFGGDKDDAPPVITNPGEELVETISPSPSPSATPTDAGGNAAAPEGNTGDTKADDRTLTAAGQSASAKNFTLTLEAVNKPAGDEFNKPEEGKEFVELVLVVENNSERDYVVSSLLMFNAYQDGFTISESLSAHLASDYPTMDGTLAAGKKLRGKLAYELPADWKELEIDVDFSAFGLSKDEQVKIILQNQ